MFRFIDGASDHSGDFILFIEFGSCAPGPGKLLSPSSIQLTLFLYSYSFSTSQNIEDLKFVKLGSFTILSKKNNFINSKPIIKESYVC